MEYTTNKQTIQDRAEFAAITTYNQVMDLNADYQPYDYEPTAHELAEHEASMAHADIILAATLF